MSVRKHDYFVIVDWSGVRSSQRGLGFGSVEDDYSVHKCEATENGHWVAERVLAYCGRNTPIDQWNWIGERFVRKVTMKELKGAGSSAVERLPYKQEVAGSTPARPTISALDCSPTSD